MQIIDRSDVQELLADDDQDAVLVVRGGDCVIEHGPHDHSPQDGTVIARKAEVVAMLPEGDRTPETLEHIASCLDNSARDRCG